MPNTTAGTNQAGTNKSASTADRTALARATATPIIPNLPNIKLQEIDLSTSLEDVMQGMADKPGIYIFCDKDKILYVGKARNLRKRVVNYMQNNERLDSKSRLMMSKANRLQWVIAASNTEALLLEHNFIKKHKPPFNILLRDDKSFPFIYLSGNHDFPLLAMHRGSQKKPGKYYGPYPNAGAVHRSISELQKIFQIRSCSNAFFTNRSRPCLQHQIGRCTAPCVDAIGKEAYQKNVRFVADFLSGKDGKVLRELTKEMQQAADNMEFEAAAGYRDKIQAMRNLSEKQYASRTLGNLDALAVYSHGNSACVYVAKVRNGKFGDSQHFFFRAPAFDDEETLLQAFINYYYLSSSTMIPPEIITSQPLAKETFEDLEEHYGRKINYKHQVRGNRRRWLSMAYESCKSLLVSHLNNSYRLQEEMEELGRKFSLPVSRLECFDISHSSGSQTQASCVVFTAEGPSKKDYRRFNIKGITPGDDYAAIKQAVARRYTAPTEHYDGVIILIDGGVGQLKMAARALRELYSSADRSVNFPINSILISIAKDKNRHFGKEKLYLLEKFLPPITEEELSDKIATIELSPFNRNGALELLLKVRDAAHKFAITGHRRKRNKAAMSSGLDRIRGLGESRKSELIKYFGGFARIKDASIEELARVPGFGGKLALSVFEQLRK